MRKSLHIAAPYRLHLKALVHARYGLGDHMHADAIGGDRGS